MCPPHSREDNRNEGDTVWACDTKRGNCKGFHSPFIGTLRADGIPVRFDIGFQ